MKKTSLIIFDTEIKIIDNPKKSIFNPSDNNNPIIMISCLYCPDIFENSNRSNNLTNPINPINPINLINLNEHDYLNIFTTLDLDLNLVHSNKNIKIIKCINELQLIYFFNHYVNMKKPDYLSGYNICGFDFNYIRSRLIYLSNLFNRPIEKKLTEKFNLVWIENKNEINLSNNKKLNTFVCTEKYYKFIYSQIIDLAILSKKKIKLDLYNISNVIYACTSHTYNIIDIKLFNDIQTNSNLLIENQIELLGKLKTVFIHLI